MVGNAWGWRRARWARWAQVITSAGSAVSPTDFAKGLCAHPHHLWRREARRPNSMELPIVRVQVLLRRR